MLKQFSCLTSASNNTKLQDDMLRAYSNIIKLQFMNMLRYYIII